MAEDPVEMSPEARRPLPHAPLDLWEVTMGDHYRPHVTYKVAEHFLGQISEEEWRAAPAERRAAERS